MDEVQMDIDDLDAFLAEEDPREWIQLELFKEDGDRVPCEDDEKCDVKID
jgi:hypothetical protein